MLAVSQEEGATQQRRVAASASSMQPPWFLGVLACHLLQAEQAGEAAAASSERAADRGQALGPVHREGVRVWGGAHN